MFTLLYRFIVHHPVITLAAGIGWMLVLLWFTWGLYLMIMTLKRNLEAGNLTIESKILGYPWLAVMLIFDFFFNITAGTIIFLDIPRDVLFTQRLSRMLKRTGWRFNTAHYICSRYLDRFDPDGMHCRR